MTIKQLFENDGNKLMVCGDYHKCLCPFHKEKTPSCVVYDDHYHCFGCNSHGMSVDYIMNRDRCKYPDAMEILGLNNFIPKWKPMKKPQTIDFESMLNGWHEKTSSEKIQELSVKLGVDYESLCCLGSAWAPEHNAWAFAMRDIKREIVGIRLRNSDGKKWSVKGSRQGLFWPNESTPEKTIFICEGPTDTAAALTINLFAIGRPSALAYIEETIELIKSLRCTNVIIISDNDEAGRKGSKKLRNKLGVRSLTLSLPSKDLRSFVNKGADKDTINCLIQSKTWTQPQT